MDIHDILKLNEKIKYNEEISEFLKRLNILFSYYNELGDIFSFINSEGKETLIKIEEDIDIPAFINILLLGRSGVGKSTLINLLLDEKKSLEGGIGFSTTSKDIRVYQKSRVALRFYDAKGIENEETEKNYLKILKDYNRKNTYSEDNLNAIFYLIEYKKDATIIEAMDYPLFEELVNLEIPILFIITKYPYNPEKKSKNEKTEKARAEGRKKYEKIINGMISSIFSKNNKSEKCLGFLKDYVRYYFVNLVRDLEAENPIFGVDKIVSFFQKSISEDELNILEESCKKNEEEKCKKICRKNPILKYFSDFDAIQTRNRLKALKYLKNLKAGAFFSGWIPGLDIGMEYFYRHLFKKKLRALYGFDFNEASKYITQDKEKDSNGSFIGEIDNLDPCDLDVRTENLNKEKKKIKNEISKEIKNKGRNFISVVGGTGQAGGIAAQIGQIAARFSINETIQIASLALLPITSIVFGAYSCYNIHKDCHKILDIYEKAFTPLKCITLYNYISSFKNAIDYLEDISKKIIEDERKENENNNN